MVKILTQEVDLEDPTKILRCLATIHSYVFDYLQLELNKVILPL